MFSAPFCNLQRAPSWFTVGWEIAAVLLRFGGMRLIVGDVSEGTVDHSLDRKYSNSSKWVIFQRNWWYFFYLFIFFGFLCNVCAYVSLCVRCSVSVCIKGNERVCVVVYVVQNWYNSRSVCFWWCISLVWVRSGPALYWLLQTHFTPSWHNWKSVVHVVTDQVADTRKPVVFCTDLKKRKQE